MATFHIQGRMIKRDGTRIVRDDTVRADTDDRKEAFRLAHNLLRDGFTVWIWRNITRADGLADVELVERLRPGSQSRRTPSPTAGANRGVRRQQTSGHETAKTVSGVHNDSGGSGLHPPAAGSTGSTSHKLGVNRGLEWWVRPARVSVISVAADRRRATGRHRRAETPPQGGRWARFRSRFTVPPDVLPQGGSLCSAAT